MGRIFLGRIFLGKKRVEQVCWSCTYEINQSGSCWKIPPILKAWIMYAGGWPNIIICSPKKANSEFKFQCSLKNSEKEKNSFYYIAKIMQKVWSYWIDAGN